MDELVQKVVQGTPGELKECLELLSILLRDPKARNSDSIRANLNDLVQKFTLLDPDSDQFAAFIKVWANFVLDNDVNRELISKLDIFGPLKEAIINKNGCVNLVVVFLQNLILDNDSNMETVREFFNALFSYSLEAELDQFVSVSDFLRDLVEDTWLPSLEIGDLTLYTTKTMLIDEEDVEICIDLILKLSKCDFKNFTNTKIISQLCQLSDSIWVSPSHEVSNLRFLFEALGNISANMNNSNLEEQDFSLQVVLNGSNPYSFAANLVCLGNSINSREDKIQFLAKVEPNFIRVSLQRFYELSATDVVLLQGVYFYNRVWDVTISLENQWDTVIDLVSCYFKPEVMTYYPQITLLMCKFLPKLSDSISVTRQFELYDLVNGILAQLDPTKREIKISLETFIFYLVTQWVRNNVDLELKIDSIVSLLSQKIDSSSTEISFDFMLAKVNALAVLISSIYRPKLHNLVPILTDISDIVINSKSLFPASNPLLNNLRFVGAKLQETETNGALHQLAVRLTLL